MGSPMRTTSNPQETCGHLNYETQQAGMWNYDTCLDCGVNGPRYEIFTDDHATTPDSKQSEQ
jgi:hypothetical protein